MYIDKEKVKEVLTRDCGLSRMRSEELSKILANSDILSDKKEKKKVIKVRETTEVQKKVLKED